MTGQLGTTLRSRADHLAPWNADLEAIVRDGERRVRRRRAAVAGGVAGMLAVVGGATAVGVRAHTTQPQPADQDTRPLTYAVGSVIHSGDSQVDVGMPVDSFVAFTGGFLFSHAEHVYEAKNGDVHEIGDLANATTPLVAGEDGREVGWWAGRSIDLWPAFPEAQGHPNGLHNMLADGWPADSPPTVRASWGGFLWVTNGVDTEVVYLDPPDGPYESWDIRSTDPSMIQDAAARRLLIRVGDGMAVVDANLPHHLNPIENSFHTKADLVPDAPQVRGVSTGDLAPDAQHWFTTEGGHFAVYASDDGSAQQPEHEGFDGVTPYQWLSGDTIAALARRTGHPDGPVSILTCRVSTNACAVSLPDVGPAAGIVVPNGPTTGDR
jgi:hypothetical protein